MPFDQPEEDNYSNVSSVIAQSNLAFDTKLASRRRKTLEWWDLPRFRDLASHIERLETDIGNINRHA